MRKHFIIRKASFVEDDYLAVDDGALKVKSFRCAGQVSIFRRPVMAIAGEDANVMVDYDLGTVAIEFDLVNPFVAFGRLLDKGRRQRLDELQTHEHPHTRRIK